jgi:hypothetical protein
MTHSSPSSRQARTSSQLHDLRIVFRLIALLAFGLSAALVRASEPADTPGFQLNVRPLAFQANPVLNMTVVTEFTDYGRSQRKPSPQQPLYCVLHDGGFHSRGDVAAGEKTPPPQELAQLLQGALSQQGIVTTDTPGHAPQVGIFYSWGSHSVPDAEYRALFPEAAHRNLLEVASLVGGKSFVRELGVYNSNVGLWSMFSFQGREKTRRFMLDQAQNDLNYVIISAYALEDLARNEPRLLWRTTMTVAATGMSFANSLQPLVLTAGPYVGREVPALALRRTMKRGTVELGPTRIIDDDVVAVSLR